VTAPLPPFRFGVQCSSPPDITATRWRDLARKVEDLGYFRLTVSDHLDDQLAPVAALTSAADATSTLRVGALVFCNDYRHPAVLAKEAATLDILSEGRFELGMGAGWMTTDYHRVGITMDPPSVRIARLEEALHVLEGLLSDGPCHFSGEFYEIDGLNGSPKPVQRPLPICIGGRGLRRTMPLVARYAHHWNYGGGDPAEFTRCRDVIHEHCAALGRDPQEITCSVLARWAGDPKRFRDDAAAFGDVGADLALVALPKDVAGAAAVEEVAAAIEV